MSDAELMHAIYENRKVAFAFYQFAPDAVGPERDAARKALLASDAALRAQLAAPVAAPAQEMWSVSKGANEVLFYTREQAEQYIKSRPGHIASGMEIGRLPVLGNAAPVAAQPIQGDVATGYQGWLNATWTPHSSDRRHPFDAFKASAEWAAK